MFESMMGVSALVSVHLTTFLSNVGEMVMPVSICPSLDLSHVSTKKKTFITFRWSKNNKQKNSHHIWFNTVNLVNLEFVLKT